MKKILVTGACGWLGAEIVRTLLARGDQVIATDLAISPAMRARAEADPKLSPTAADLGEWHQVIRLSRRTSPMR